MKKRSKSDELVEVEFLGIPKKKRKTKKDETVLEIDDIGLDFDMNFNPKSYKTDNVKGTYEMEQIMSGKTPPKQVKRKKKKKFDDTTIAQETESIFKLYEGRFKPVMDKLDDYDDELDGFIDSRKSKLDEFENSRMKGAINASTLLTGSITALLSTKLSSIKERVTITSKISDLELKKSKDDVAASKGAGGSDDRLVQQIFTKMNDNEVADTMSLHDTFINGYYDNTSDDTLLDARVTELENDGSIDFTQAELAFKYNNLDIEIVVLRTKGDWRFAAVDKISGDEIGDYPIPDKYVVAGENGDKMKFLADGVCKDLLNVTYTYYDVDEI